MENVMNKIGETAMKACRYTAETTGKIAREIKLKARMADNKSKIKELYEDIGRRVYENHIVDVKTDENIDFKKDCEEIDKLANEVEDIRMQILNLKDLKQCPKCYYEIDLEFHFCPNCGKEQEITDQAKQNDGPATIETLDDTAIKLKREKADIKEINYNDEKEENQELKNEIDIDNYDEELEDNNEE